MREQAPQAGTCLALMELPHTVLGPGGRPEHQVMGKLPPSLTCLTALEFGSLRNPSSKTPPSVYMAAVQMARTQPLLCRLSVPMVPWGAELADVLSSLTGLRSLELATIASWELERVGGAVG